MRWKLFPFSLIGEAEQWYAHTIESVNGDWGELRDNFCHSFSLMERTEQWNTRVASLPINILDFEKLEEESLGAAWARFLHLLVSTPGPSLPIDV